MSNFNNQKQCVVCGEEQKENSIGLWIDVSDLWKLEKNTIRACCSLFLVGFETMPDAFWKSLRLASRCRPLLKNYQYVI